MSLIKNSLFNFIKCLRLYWIPLVILLGGALIGFFASFSTLNDTSKEVYRVVNEVYPNSESEDSDYKWFLLGSLFNEDLSKETLEKLLSENYTYDTITEFVKEKYNPTEAQMNYIINEIDVESIPFSTMFIILISCVAISYLIGYFLTKSLVRRKLAKIKWWQGLICTGINAILSSFILVGLTTMLTGFNIAGIIVAAVSMLITNIVLLLEAYYLHRNKRTNMKEIITIKNCLYLYLASLIITTITMVASSFLSFIPIFPLITAVIMFPLTVIALAVVNLNAESYVLMRNREIAGH